MWKQNAAVAGLAFARIKTGEQMAGGSAFPTVDLWPVRDREAFRAEKSAAVERQEDAFLPGFVGVAGSHSM